MNTKKIHEYHFSKYLSSQLKSEKEYNSKVKIDRNMTIVKIDVLNKRFQP